jgi:lysophospholipase L1-like esterase
MELVLTTRWPDRKVTFRNLGWSADDVFGESRKYYGSYRSTTLDVGGRERLLANVEAFDATVVFANYGANAAAGGSEALEAFLRGYRSILDELEEGGVRIVLVSPIPRENLGAPYPDQAGYNENLGLYADAIGRLARERGHYFADLFRELPNAARDAGQLTDNGIHLTARGYSYAAAALEAALGWDESDREPLSAQQSEELRQLIVEKDRLYFHSYRPQNDTYLRGFREYEQGNNAGELLEFLPLIRIQEEKIRELRKPRSTEESK